MKFSNNNQGINQVGSLSTLGGAVVLILSLTFSSLSHGLELDGSINLSVAGKSAPITHMRYHAMEDGSVTVDLTAKNGNSTILLLPKDTAITFLDQLAPGDTVTIQGVSDQIINDCSAQVRSRCGTFRSVCEPVGDVASVLRGR